MSLIKFNRYIDSVGLKATFYISIMLFVSLFALSESHAKIYIDIASPGIRKLPISIETTGPESAKEVEKVVKEDLEATGLVTIYDPDVPGAEIRAKMDVDMSVGMTVTLSVADLIENRVVVKNRFSSSQDTSIRSMAHSVSNSIYKVITGKKGPFRTKLSYLVNTSKGKKELHVMDWDGHNSVRLVARGLTAAHNWTQDGRFVLYSSERKRKWNIYMRSITRRGESTLFSSKGLNLVGGTSAGDLVSFSSSKDGSSEIYTINVYGKGLRKLTRSFGIDVSPVFSPDGKKIAFVSDRGGTPQIYIMDDGGGVKRRITFIGSYNTSPAWSPDGKWIAYTGRTNGKNQIFVVKFDGSETRQLTDRGNNESPTFSPDGLFIAFDSDRNRQSGVYVMRVNGEGQKRITPHKMKAMTPRWSPYLK
jgi:TolB protein